MDTPPPEDSRRRKPAQDTRLRRRRKRKPEGPPLPLRAGLRSVGSRLVRPAPGLVEGDQPAPGVLKIDRGSLVALEGAVAPDQERLGLLEPAKTRKGGPDNAIGDRGPP